MSVSTPLLADELSPPPHAHGLGTDDAPDHSELLFESAPPKWASEKGQGEVTKGRRWAGMQLIAMMLLAMLFLGGFGGFHLGGGRLATDGHDLEAAALEPVAVKVKHAQSAATVTVTKHTTSTATATVLATATKTVTVQIGTPLDPAKLAVMIEPRNERVLVPILLDFIQKVPVEWAHQLWTSQATIDALDEVVSLRQHFESGKFSTRLIPDAWNVHDGKSLSAFMVDPWFWEQLAPAEHILTYQTDSILCGNSEFTVNDFLGTNMTATKLEGGYAYVGAVWAKHGYPAPPNGGNGGLSIRRRSIMLDVTQKELDWTRWNEDMWLVQGVKRHYDSDKAFPDQDVAMRFSFEAAPRGTEHWDWVAKPLGLHAGSGCAHRNHKYPELIRKLVDHCPEARMVLPSDCLPPDLKSHW